jgi:hypothetical protein
MYLAPCTPSKELTGTATGCFLLPEEVSVSLKPNVATGHHSESVLFHVKPHNLHLNIILPFPSWTSSGRFPRGFLTKTVHTTFLLCPIRPVCHIHLSHTDFNTLTTCGDVHKTRTFSLCNIVKGQLIPRFFKVCILNSWILYSSLRDLPLQVTGKIIVWFICFADCIVFFSPSSAVSFRNWSLKLPCVADWYDFLGQGTSLVQVLDLHTITQLQKLLVFIEEVRGTGTYHRPKAVSALGRDGPVSLSSVLLASARFINA